LSDRIRKTLKNKLKQFWGIKQTGNALARKMGFDDEQEYLAYLKHQMDFLKQWDKERDAKQKKKLKKRLLENYKVNTRTS
jgi:HD superfamily phosphohydrolase YqeK